MIGLFFFFLTIFFMPFCAKQCDKGSIKITLLNSYNSLQKKFLPQTYIGVNWGLER